MSKANILVVDDTPHNLELLSNILEDNGYAVRCVTDGLTALDIAQKKWPQLILLDIRLPKIDGYEVCQKLKNNDVTREIPIIFLSALDDSVNKIKAFSVGGLDYINKPFHLEEVLVRVETQINLQAAKAKIEQFNAELEQQVKQRTLELEAANRKLQQEIEQRRITQDKMMRLALYDSITGLPNRKSFVGKVRQALQQTAKQSDYKFAVLLLDCDYFKQIRYSLGHLNSNQLLIAIANKISSCLPSSSGLSRAEGDEFAIFLDNITSINQVINFAQKIQQHLKLPFQIEHHQLIISCSIAIVISNSNYQDGNSILQDADIAMSQAKAKGSGNIQVFKPGMSVSLPTYQRDPKLELALKQAYNNKQFQVYYQPIYSLSQNKIIGLEALLRWQHPSRGLISPSEFIHLIEETELIIPLWDFVLDQACHQMRLWQQSNEHLVNLNLSVNVSGKQFFQANLIEKIDKILEKSKLESHYLQLDIPESIINQDSSFSHTIFQELNKRQIKINLDTFGTGASSLTLLHNFTINNLKLDFPLIKKLNQNEADANSSKILIQQIITIAHQMNLTVTAEGIETPEQLEYLKGLGCDYGQGYLFSKALDRKSIEEFLLWTTWK